MLGYSDDVTGAQVLAIEPDSEAFRAGLREGDVVTEINRKAIDGTDDLMDKAEDGSDKLLLHVRRGRGCFLRPDLISGEEARIEPGR